MATRLSNSVTCTVDITQLGQMFEAAMTKTQKDLSNGVLTELVMHTPIDTGRAKSNWIVGVNSLGAGPIPAHDPGVLGSTFNENAQQAIADGAQEIARVTFRDTVNVTNNLDYIRKLNDGSSQQAPAGFVEDAVVTAVHAIPNVKIIP
jgi:hypothetical protein